MFLVRKKPAVPAETTALPTDSLPNAPGVPSVAVGSRIRILKSSISVAALDQFRRRCTFDVPVSGPSGVDHYITVKLHSEDDDYIFVPRAFEIAEKFYVTAKDFMSDAPVRVWPKPKITLFSWQEGIAAEILAKGNNHLITLPPSSGKTILSLMCAHRLKQRTVVLVDSTIIMEGWINDIGKCFGIPREKVGIVKETKMVIGEHFTIAMLQTLRGRDDLESFFRKFGTLIADEVHVAPAKTYFPIINLAPCRNRIGLTATPRRRDGLHPMMYLLFGEKGHTRPMDETDGDTSMPISEARMIVTKFYTRETKIRAYMIKRACNCAERNKLILDAIQHELLSQRKPIVVCSTKAHAEMLYKATQELMPTQDGLILQYGGSTQKKNQALVTGFREGKLKCLFTTIKYFEKGASIPELETMIVTAQVGYAGNYEQLLGRIRRRLPDKKPPIVYDVFDHFVPSDVRRWKFSHAKVYEKLKIPVRKWPNDSARQAEED